jgi:hypothetical protein
MRRRGILKLTPEVLDDLLHLPKDWRVKSAKWDPILETVDFLIEGGALPIWIPGQQVANIDPMIILGSHER